MKEILDKLIINPELILNQIVDSINNGKPALFTYINQNTFNLLCKNLEYYQVLRDKFNLYSDGTGMWILNRIVDKKYYKLFNATDLNYMVMNYLSNLEANVFIAGGKFDPNFLSKVLAEKKLKLSGYVDGYKEHYDFEKIADVIRKDSVSVVFVAMGPPKQEYFAKEIFNRNTNKVILCVGNFLEYYVGTQKRAPKLLINSGFEWTYRLLIEPKRLWKRYLLGIPIFLFSVVKLFLKNKIIK